MKIKIKKEEWKKIVLEDFEVEIPEKARYYWHNGVRVAYSVKPVWTTWNKKHYGKEEEIYELSIVSVDPTLNEVSLMKIRISDISEIIHNEKHPLNRLIENVVLRPKENTRTKKQFMDDYKTVLKTFSSNL